MPLGAQTAPPVRKGRQELRARKVLQGQQDRRDHRVLRERKVYKDLPVHRGHKALQAQRERKDLRERKEHKDQRAPMAPVLFFEARGILTTTILSTTL